MRLSPELGGGLKKSPPEKWKANGCRKHLAKGDTKLPIERQGLFDIGKSSLLSDYSNTFKVQKIKHVENSHKCRISGNKKDSIYLHSTTDPDY